MNAGCQTCAMNFGIARGQIYVLLGNAFTKRLSYLERFVSKNSRVQFHAIYSIQISLGQWTS